jgi:osmotically-inducible protein OsmY
MHQGQRGRQGGGLREEEFASERGRGQFSGRGPKGYRRSDERITEEICEQLTRNDEIDPSDIEVSVQNGEVTLTGNVEDRRFKRMAEDIAERVSGVSEVSNQIRIKKKEQQSNRWSSERAKSE